MDWVDYKRICARYREPYKELSDHCTFLLIHGMRAYNHFRDLSLEGEPDYILVSAFGKFLYYVAELESLTVHHGISQRHCDSEYKMMTSGLDVLIACKYDSTVTRDKIIVYCSQWARKFFGVAYNNRHYMDAMKTSRRELQEKHGF